MTYALSSYKRIQTTTKIVTIVIAITSFCDTILDQRAYATPQAD